MATITKRTWGEGKTAWVCRYADQAGKWRLKTFKTRKAADAWLVQARHEVARGVHIPDHGTGTVAHAAHRWLTSAEARGLERSTVEQYRQHVEIHIVPRIGTLRLARVNRQIVEDFRDALCRDLSLALAAKILVSLRAILRSADRPVDVRMPTGGQKRHRKRLEIGREVPDRGEVRKLLAGSDGPGRAVLALASLAGLRSSEIRGLAWADVDFTARVITVRQRADRWGEIGSPKSEDAQRDIPIGPELARILKEWKLACGPAELVFPTDKGRPLQKSDLQKRIVGKAQRQAGTRSRGLHAYRHFYASWLLDQGLPLKVVQHRLGHSSIVITSDRYGHLMPETADDRAQADAAERALLA